MHHAGLHMLPALRRLAHCLRARFATVLGHEKGSQGLQHIQTLEHRAGLQALAALLGAQHCSKPLTNPKL